MGYIKYLHNDDDDDDDDDLAITIARLFLVNKQANNVECLIFIKMVYIIWKKHSIQEYHYNMMSDINMHYIWWQKKITIKTKKSSSIFLTMKIAKKSCNSRGESEKGLSPSLLIYTQTFFALTPQTVL